MKSLKITILTLLLLAGAATAHAARIDTVAIHSAGMHRAIPAVVVTPDAAGASGRRWPVLYLLHGYDGDEHAWQRIADLGALADRFGMIVVCPDGENSWYWDSPADPTLRFEHFIAEELPAWVDGRYPTLARREGRAVTGLSMGGHGALWIACRHKERFAAAGSMSGGVDIRPFPEGWRMRELLGASREEDPALWDAHTVMTAAESLADGELAIVFDCGYDDFFFEVNRRLHELLRRKGVKHDYIVRPGGHDNAYWGNALPYQMLFFARAFERLAAAQ